MFSTKIKLSIAMMGKMAGSAVSSLVRSNSELGATTGTMLSELALDDPLRRLYDHALKLWVPATGSAAPRGARGSHAGATRADDALDTAFPTTTPVMAYATTAEQPPSTMARVPPMSDANPAAAALDAPGTLGFTLDGGVLPGYPTTTPYTIAPPPSLATAAMLDAMTVGGDSDKNVADAEPARSLSTASTASRTASSISEMGGLTDAELQTSIFVSHSRRDPGALNAGMCVRA